MRDTTDKYASVAQLKPVLNNRKNQPSAKFTNRVSRSGREFPERSKRAASAGLSVSELNVEIKVETAIVSANWRKNCPTIPDKKAHGMKTALSTTPIATTGGVTSSMARIAASRGASPFSM